MHKRYPNVEEDIFKKYSNLQAKDYNEHLQVS